MVDIAKLSVVVDADTSAAEHGLESFGTKVSGAGGALTAAFGAAAIGGIAAVGAGLAEAVTAASGFESTMSAVKAVSGATGAEMSQLSGLALQLGKDTSFSASEAGKGIEELVKGGLSIPDIMNGAAQATLNLAAAGGVSLPDAATIAANALAQFNLKGEDMAHVADLIAGAANASAIDVGDFKFSLASAGAVASTVGFSFDDLAQGIAVMGAAGIKGSDAGTSLKTMMLNLQPQTNKQKDLFRELGLETSNLQAGLDAMRAKGIEPLTEDWPGLNAAMSQYLGLSQDSSKWSNEQRSKFDDLYRSTGAIGSAFFDATGKVKSMAEVAQVLQDATKGMTEAQRLATLETIFGSDAIRAGAVLAKAGAEGFNEMAGAMGKVTAEAVGAEKLNNLAGAWEQLKGSAETLAITVGMKLLPFLTDLTKWATEAVNKLIPMFEHIETTFGEMFTAQEIAQMTSLLNELKQTVTEVAGAIAQAWSEHGDEIQGTSSSAWKAILADTIARTRELLAAIRLVIQVANGDWQGAWQTMSDIHATETERIVAQQTHMADQTQQAIDKFTGGMLSKFEQSMTDLGGIVQSGWESVTGITQTAWDAVSETVSTAWDAIATTTTTAVKNVLDPIVTTWDAIETATTTVMKAVQNVITAIWTAIYDAVLKPKLDAIAALVDTTWQAVHDAIDAKLTLVQAVVGAAWDAVSSKTTEVLNAVLAFVRDTIFEPIRSTIETAMNEASRLFGEAVQAISDAAHRILDPILAYWRDTIWEPIRAAVDTAMYGPKGAHTQFTSAVDGISNVVNGTLQNIKTAWESVWAAIQKAAESPQEAMKVIIDLIGKLKDIMPDWLIPHSPTPFQIGLEGIMKAAKEMDGAFAGMGSSVSGAVSDWLKAAMKLAGVSDNWLPGLERLAGWESTGNPHAVNPQAVSGQHATGLLQTLPSTFRHYALPGMDDIFNPVHNAAAAIRYIKATYGSVYEIPGVKSGNHGDFPGYASGGWAGLHGPEMAMLGERGPEYVIPNSALRGGGGNTYVDLRGAQVYDGSKFEDILVNALDRANRRGRLVKVTS